MEVRIGILPAVGLLADTFDQIRANAGNMRWLEIMYRGAGINPVLDEIATIMPECVNLTKITVSERSISEKYSLDGVKFGKFIKSCDGRLTELKCAVTMLDYGPVMEALQCCVHVTKLRLWDLDNIGVAQLATKLRYFQELETLELEYLGGYLSYAGAIVLANELPRCAALANLTLMLCDVGLVAIADILLLLANLKVVTFELVDALSEHGAKAIAAVLPYCINLESLNFPMSQIDDDGATELAKGLRYLRRRLNVSIEHHTMTKKGVEELIQVATVNPNVSFSGLFDDLYNYDYTNLYYAHQNVLRRMGYVIPVAIELLPEPAEADTVSEWIRARHKTFGEEVNRLFAALTLGIQQRVQAGADPEAMFVPEFDPEMLEEALGHYSLKDLTPLRVSLPWPEEVIRCYRERTMVAKIQLDGSDIRAHIHADELMRAVKVLEHYQAEYDRIETSLNEMRELFQREFSESQMQTFKHQLERMETNKLAWGTQLERLKTETRNAEGVRLRQNQKRAYEE